jgi:hypothetical protein
MTNLLISQSHMIKPFIETSTCNYEGPFTPGSRALIHEKSPLNRTGLSKYLMFPGFTLPALAL